MQAQERSSLFHLVEWVDSNFTRCDHFACTSWDRFVVHLHYWLVKNHRYFAKLVPNPDDKEAVEAVKALPDPDFLLRVQEWENTGLIRWKLEPSIGGQEAGCYPPRRTAVWPSFVVDPPQSRFVSRDDIIIYLKELYIDNKFDDQITVVSEFRQSPTDEKWKYVMGRSIRVETYVLLS